MGGEEKRQRQTELDGRVKSIESCLSLRGFLKLIFASRLDKIISEFKKSQLIILCFNLAYLGTRMHVRVYGPARQGRRGRGVEGAGYDFMPPKCASGAPELSVM
jgi:hypothetical protein